MWDHAIETKEGFVLRKWKMYLLLRKERGEMCKFIEEQLSKEYIRLSKSPQIALVFFVGKKNGKKRIVENYRYLNEWTIKYNYPLSFILEIVENIGIKKVFTKLDLQWGYNNIWIKEGNKWKTVFTTLQGSFEPSVIFFELTNSLVTFQMMMNKILQNLINTREVVSFIDDIIVGTEEEEKYNEVVKEVVKRLAKNDLYVKLKKYKWKVKKVLMSSDRTGGD